MLEVLLGDDDVNFPFYINLQILAIFCSIINVAGFLGGGKVLSRIWSPASVSVLYPNSLKNGPLHIRALPALLNIGLIAPCIAASTVSYVLNSTRLPSPSIISTLVGAGVRFWPIPFLIPFQGCFFPERATFGHQMRFSLVFSLAATSDFCLTLISATE